MVLKYRKIPLSKASAASDHESLALLYIVYTRCRGENKVLELSILCAQVPNPDRLLWRHTEGNGVILRYPTTKITKFYGCNYINRTLTADSISALGINPQAIFPGASQVR